MIEDALRNLIREIVAEVNSARAEQDQTTTPIVVTLDRAAELLSCSPRYVQRLADTGKLPAVYWSDVGRPKRYFRVVDLLAAAAAHVKHES